MNLNGMRTYFSTTEGIQYYEIRSEDYKRAAKEDGEIFFDYSFTCLMLGEDFLKYIEEDNPSDNANNNHTIFVDGFMTNLALFDIPTNVVGGKYLIDKDLFKQLCKTNEIVVDVRDPRNKKQG